MCTELLALQSVTPRSYHHALRGTQTGKGVVCPGTHVAYSSSQSISLSYTYMHAHAHTAKCQQTTAIAAISFHLQPEQLAGCPVHLSVYPSLEKL